MICLTADIHHQGLRTGNQRASDRTEVDLAIDAMKMADSAGIKLTYFLTGKLVDDAPETCETFAANPNLEIGGHNYWCFEPKLAHRIWKKATGDYAGPMWLQQLDTHKTVDSIERRLGRRVRSWRNHMYMHGPKTDEVLLQNGIRICSDGVARECSAPRRKTSGLWEMPINTIPDHEHLFHAERTPRWVRRWQERYSWSDDFGPESYFIDEWASLLLEGVAENEAQGRDSMILIHPITMYLCDGFAAYKNILRTLTKYQSVTLTELLEERTNETHRTEAACA